MKPYLQLSILFLIISLAFTEFVPSDRLYGPVTLKNGDIYYYPFGDLTPFPDSVFGTSYVGTDNSIYAIFFKHGNN